jgi:hypothetical protein
MNVVIYESSTQNNCQPRKVWSKSLVNHKVINDKDNETFSDAERLCQQWYNEGVSNAEEGSPEVQLLLYSVDIEI